MLPSVKQAQEEAADLKANSARKLNEEVDAAKKR